MGAPAYYEREQKIVEREFWVKNTGFYGRIDGEEEYLEDGSAHFRFVSDKFTKQK